ncbi:MAG: hypothetical protein IT260_09960, partial [Saprospiraceae bacterium]|nr:hypothetical protein [Saprospiraceae bacterium]
GQNLQPGGCVNWYYGTNDTFNPYNGEGTLLGCGAIQAPPPNPCVLCPTILAIQVDACGTEENNEFLSIWSGSGFLVNDATLNFDLANDGPNAGDFDIAPGGCGWQEPSALAISSIQNSCPTAIVVGAGPGESVPAGVPVIVFTSSGLDANYNFTNLCAAAPLIYVMQNSCARTIGAFSNGTSSGPRNTIFGLACGCSWSTTYTCELLSFGNGDYVTDAGLPAIYGNSGCSIPLLPAVVPVPVPVTVQPFTATVTASMCNGGPFWVVGVVSPLPGSCAEPLTNYLPFDVVCAQPNLDSATVCQNSGLLDLNSLADPLAPTGTWSGPGVSGANFDPGGLNGPQVLNFVPSDNCSLPAATAVTVDVPTASFDALGPVCKGQPTDLQLQFTGLAPWSFDFYTDGVYTGTFFAATSPFSIPIAPVNATTYSLQGFQDAQCAGADASTTVSVVDPPLASLAVVGLDTICANTPDSLALTVVNGTPPYTVVYSINGVAQAPLTANALPFGFITPPLSAGLAVVKLDSLYANGCIATVSGMDTIFVKPAPLASIPTDTVTRCAGLTDTLVVHLSGPAPYTLEYVVNMDTLSPVVTSDTAFKIPVAVVPGLTVIRLLSVAGGGCVGQVQGTYSIFAEPLATAVLSGDTTICGGEPAPLLIDFTGTPPFIFNYTANGVPLADTSVFDPRVLIVSPAVPTIYQATGVSTKSCPGTVSGSATVNVLPGLTATLSGGGQICQGGSGTSIAVTFQGPGPYTFVYSVKTGGQAPVNQPPITTSLNPYVIAVNPPVGTIYQLISVTNGTCTGTVTGLAVVAVFTPSTALLSGDLTFCQAADTSVMVDFTGSGPFSLVYAVNNVAQPVVETFDDPYFIPVNITSTATYTLVSVESPGCLGIINGSATVTINYPPTYPNLVFNCNFAAGTYTVEFDVLNAQLPLTLVNGSGTFTGLHFTSNALPIAQAYDFVFHDANDCGDVQVSGPASCNCHTSAGTMNLTPLSACLGSAATATHNSNQTLDPSDTLLFILHTNPALPIGQILAWSPTPQFSFGTGMLPNVTYYISAIAGAADPMGLVNLSDPCLSISQGTPVVFYEVPTASVDSIGPVCPGDLVSIPLQFTGAPPFSFSYTLNGVAATPVTNILTTSFSLDLVVNEATSLVISSVTDLRCTSGPSDSLNIEVQATPDITDLFITCDLVTDTYVLEFDASGIPPFLVTGIAGSFVGNHFTSLPVSINLAYSFQVSDVFACGAVQVDGLPNCSCLTDAGTVDTTAAEACVGSPISVLKNPDEALDVNDTLGYMLHTGVGLAGKISLQNHPEFNFDPATMTPETVYYISAVAGDNTGSGMVDTLDQCFSVSPGMPVVWHAIPTASIDAASDICPGDNVLIPVNMTGVPPFTLTYTENGQSNTVIAVQNTFTLSATLLQSTIFEAVLVSNQFCPGTASGQAVITVHPAPQITGVSVNCLPDNLFYTVEFDVLGADFSSVAITGIASGTFDPVTGHFTSNPISTQSGYTAVVSDAWLCGLDSISGGANCSCTTSAGTLSPGTLSLCLADTATAAPANGFFLGVGDTLLYALVTSSSPLSWTILATSTTPAFAFDPASMSPGVVYFIVCLAGNKAANGVDNNDPCLSYAVGPNVSWQVPAVASVGFDTDICQGDSASLLVLFSGNAPYQFVYQVNGQSQAPITSSALQYSLMVSPTATTTYSLGSLVANGCPGAVQDTALVTVHPNPQILNLLTTCDLATETYTLQFQIDNGVEPNTAYSVNGLAGTLLDSTFTSVPLSSGQQYSIVVSSTFGCTAAVSGTANCQCVSDAGTLDPAPLSICLPDPAVAQANNDATLDAEDKRQYILYQDVTMLPAGILAVSNTPSFNFLPGMVTGQTYFMASMAGDGLPTGDVDVNDPCLSISPGLPVVFHDRPTATIAGDTTVCAGGSVRFKIQFTGVAPFSFLYSVNTVQQAPITSPQNSFTIITNNVQGSQEFVLVSVQDAFCAGTVSGIYTVDLQPAPQGAVLADTTICAGGTATLTLQLSGGTSYDLSLVGGPTPLVFSGIQTGTVVPVTPGATSTYSISNLSAVGNVCPPEIGQDATVTLAPPISTTAQITDFGGFNVSCPGELDGSIALSTSGGVPPLGILWSTGDAGSSIADLPAGDYAATLTDAIGCQRVDSFSLTAPAELTISTALLAPTCAGERNGAITITNIEGGVGPFAISLNGVAQQTTDVFPVVLANLAAGQYDIAAADLNGCETQL